MFIIGEVWGGKSVRTSPGILTIWETRFVAPNRALPRLNGHWMIVESMKTHCCHDSGQPKMSIFTKIKSFSLLSFDKKTQNFSKCCVFCVFCVFLSKTMHDNSVKSHFAKLAKPKSRLHKRTFNPEFVCIFPNVSAHCKAKRHFFIMLIFSQSSFLAPECHWKTCQFHDFVSSCQMLLVNPLHRGVYFRSQA